MADEKKEAAPAAPAAGGDEEEKKPVNHLVMVLAVIVGIVVIQTVIVYFIVPKPKPEMTAEELRVKAEEDSIKKAEEAATKVGAFTSDAPVKATVNIAGTDGERFLKAEIIFEYDEKNKALGDELRRRAPKYTDMLIVHLSALTLIELTEPGAKDKICGDMLRMVNASLPPNMGGVRRVILQSFLIQ